MTDPIPPERLTDEQQTAARAWLDQHWSPHVPCPFHGPTQWTVDTSFALVPAMPNILSGRVFVMLVVSCSICWYTVFVNAKQAGIWSLEEKPALAVEQPQPTVEAQS